MSGLIMQPKVEVLTPPQLSEAPVIACYRCEVEDFAVEDVMLADADEVATFVTDKRRMEHLSGRWLLQYSLIQWGIDSIDEIEVRRDEFRAPSLKFIHGIWRNEPLPSISIGHGNGWAYVAIIEPGWSIGIDAEPAERGIAMNAFDLMSKGEELTWLRKNPKHAIRLWTSKESIQKAMRKGMHLNPRDILIPIENNISIISIENSKIQLKNWIFKEANISLAWRHNSIELRTSEDDLLDATRKAMQEQEWGVGCKTTTGNS